MKRLASFIVLFVASSLLADPSPQTRSAIFAGGALLCFGIMLQTHSSAEIQAYWHSAGLAHAFWYTITAMMGCIGYGSVFLAAGMLMRNPIIPAAVLLGWEAINGFLPAIGPVLRARVVFRQSQRVATAEPDSGTRDAA